MYVCACEIAEKAQFFSPFFVTAGIYCIGLQVKLQNLGIIIETATKSAV